MRRSLRSLQVPAGNDLRDALQERFPFAYAWDDHDYCWNNSDGSCWARDLALQVYDEYWPSRWPSAARRAPGLWHSFRYGRLVEVFVLDLRSQRSPETGTALGAAQMSWLQRALSSSPSRWKIIVSSSAFNRTVWKQTEAWSFFPGERAQLVELFGATDPGHIIVVSGDIHSGGAIDDGTYADVPELSVPHTNLAPGLPASCDLPLPGYTCGKWSEFLYDPLDDASAGYAGYGLVIATPDDLEIVVRSQDGSVQGTMRIFH